MQNSVGSTSSGQPWVIESPMKPITTGADVGSTPATGVSRGYLIIIRAAAKIMFNYMTANKAAAA